MCRQYRSSVLHDMPSYCTSNLKECQYMNFTSSLARNCIQWHRNSYTKSLHLCTQYSFVFNVHVKLTKFRPEFSPVCHQDIIWEWQLNWTCQTMLPVWIVNMERLKPSYDRADIEYSSWVIPIMEGERSPNQKEDTRWSVFWCGWMYTQTVTGSKESRHHYLTPDAVLVLPSVIQLLSTLAQARVIIFYTVV